MGQDNLLSEAAKLVEALTATGVEFQERFRAEDDSDEERERALAQLSNQWNPEPYNVMVRRLEMAGIDEAAAKFIDLETTVHRIVTALDPGKYWEMEDALEDINVDVGAMRQNALDELARVREHFAGQEKGATSAEQKERVGVLTEAAVLADKLYFLSLEHESYRDGSLPLPENEDESAEEGIRRVASEYDQQNPAPIIEWLESQGFRAAAAALDDLLKAASYVVRLGEDDDIDEQVLDKLSAIWKKAIDALKDAR